MTQSQTSSKIFIFILLISLTSSLKTFLKSRSTDKLTLLQTTQVKEAFCFLNTNGTIYDLNPMRNSTNDYLITGPSYGVNINFCENTINSCDNKKGMMYYHDDTGRCILLSGPANVVSNWQLNSILTLIIYRE